MVLLSRRIVLPLPPMRRDLQSVVNLLLLTALAAVGAAWLVVRVAG